MNDQLEIGVVKGTTLVVLQFDNPILHDIETPKVCMKFNPEAARALGRMLLKKADEAEFPTPLPPNTQ